ncbi:hypothetical protein N0B31_11320 [Salinirubellus salinus]|uniref:Uncharacterized protein n=1 Tax=Salinirubellus salinus TaxID=1364945 RepID=A0A9E7U6U3_9EURY|nr:hypothetical protein [Salinirubellus salinus]UWM52741.1 hypothetical protein N0B31_11320 [Salinirubellus salinus]
MGSGPLIGIILLPLLMLVLHELTHVIAARLVSPVSVDLVSVVPLRLDLNFAETPSVWHTRFIALSPAIVGTFVLVCAVWSGLWAEVQRVEPYFLDHLLILDWIVYAHVSPADLRAGLRPKQALRSREVGQ